MIQNILTQSAMAFRGHQAAGAQVHPQHLALSLECTDKPGCPDYPGPWDCENTLGDGCYALCFKRFPVEFEKAFPHLVVEIDGKKVCMVADEAPPTQSPPVTDAPATQAPVTQAPATQAPVTQAPATQAPVTQPPATLGPCIPVEPTESPTVTNAPTESPPVTNAPTESPPVTNAPTKAPIEIDTTKHEDQVPEGYVPFTPPARNTSQNYMFNTFATGQSGNGSYATIMGVSPQELTGGVMNYNDLENQKASDCMWCDNLWGLEWHEQDFSKGLDDGKYRTHTEYRMKTPTEMNYKDYSDSSAEDDYIVGAYVTEWSIYRASGKYGIDAVPFNKALDYVLYGFMPVCGKGSDNLGQLGLCTVQDCTSYESDSNSYFALNQACEGLEPGTVVVHDPWAAFAGYSSMMTTSNLDAPNAHGGFHLLMNAKAEHKHKIRIMPSVGGWSLSKIFFDMHDDTIRHNFVNSAANLLTAWPFFDGIDIDWEFPGGLGADSGLVEFASAAETHVTNQPLAPVWGGSGCGLLEAASVRPRTIWTSWANMHKCDTFSNKGALTKVDISPLGCSHSKEKREEIASSYSSWGQYGLNTKDKYIDCQCDADIGYKLFTDLRAALDNVPLSERPSDFGIIDRYQITTATSGAPDKINEVDYGRLVEEGKLDHVFIMSYDFMGAWSNQVGHQSNLFAHEGGDATPVSITQSVQAFLDQGVPSEKILVGVASYGRGWRMGEFSADGTDEQILSNAWNTKATGACEGDIEPGVVDYNSIYNLTKDNSMKQVWDSCAMAHLTVGQIEVNGQKVWEIYTGDSPESVWAKGDFVQKNNLGGLFTWELSQDSHEAPLINVMNEALGRSPSGGSAQKPNFDYDSSNSRCSVSLDHVKYSERDFNITCEK